MHPKKCDGMNILKTPITNYSNYSDVIKFSFVWAICRFQFIILTVATLINIKNPNYNIYPNLASITVVFVALVIMYFKKKYKVISIVGLLISIVIIWSAMLFIRNVAHTNIPLWIVLTILFAYFVFGKKWGIITTICNFLVLTYYFIFLYPDNMSNLPEFNRIDVISFIIESFIIFLGIIYFIFKYSSILHYNQEKLLTANQSLKKNKDIIEKQFEEISMLYNEIHHRIKNNLNIIISMISLKIPDDGEWVDKNILEDSVNRIKTIAAIHESMFNVQPKNSFNLQLHIKTLINNILRLTDENIEFTLNIDNPRKVGQYSIVLFSLILNELITNSIKHAFHNIKTPKISINFKESKTENYYDLYYSDNGHWKNEKKEEDTLGTVIINSMIKQIDGKCEIVKDKDGTYYSVTGLNIFK